MPDLKRLAAERLYSLGTDRGAALAAEIERGDRVETNVPMIVVSADHETVAIVEQAVRDPTRYLTERHQGLTGDQRLATAIVMALWWHSWGMELTAAEPPGKTPWREPRCRAEYGTAASPAGKK